MVGLSENVKAVEVETFTEAPRFAPRRRLDETRAAREPQLVWSPPDLADAAE